MIKRKLLFVAIALLALPVGLSAQKYKLQKMVATRYSIDKRWDALIPKEDKAFIAPYKVKVDSLMKPVLGRSAVNMTSHRPESLLPNFIADVLLKAAVPYGGADMAVMNIGGVRSVLPVGDINFGEVFEISPFENHYTILTMHGQDVLTLFAQIAKVGGEGLSGAKITITKDGRLLNAEIAGNPVSADSTYRIATLDYLAEGNDKMEAFRLAVKKNITDKLVRQVLIDYIKGEAAQGRAVTAKMEGRVTVVDK
jgi:2',3'-cyclic-nucleotide 2'-phosphodiesterase (5'-nucleotidase family)